MLDDVSIDVTDRNQLYKVGQLNTSYNALFAFTLIVILVCDGIYLSLLL